MDYYNLTSHTRVVGFVSPSTSQNNHWSAFISQRHQANQSAPLNHHTNPKKYQTPFARNHHYRKIVLISTDHGRRCLGKPATTAPLTPTPTPLPGESNIAFACETLLVSTRSALFVQLVSRPLTSQTSHIMVNCNPPCLSHLRIRVLPRVHR